MKKIISTILVSFAVLQASTLLADEKEPAGAPSEGMQVFQSDDGTVRLWLTSRLHLNAAAYLEGDNDLASGIEVRRARLGFKAALATNWTAELEADFADDEAEVKDAWLAYNGLESTSIKIGHHKEPFSLEELTSSKYTTFIERALLNVFAPGRHLGASFSTWRERWYFGAGVFGEEAGDVDETGEDEGLGVSARFVTTPVRRDGRIFHFGLSAAARTPEAGSGDRIRFRSRPETHVNRARFVNTGRIDQVDQFTLLGLETAIQLGDIHLQGEYILADVVRSADRGDASFDGWYAFISWFPTGEFRPYEGNSAEFGKLTPKGKRGAFELAVRYSTVDLTDLAAGIEGGGSEILTLGLNWYLFDRARLMFNFNSVRNDQFADGDGDFIGNDNFEVIQASLQFNL